MVKINVIVDFLKSPFISSQDKNTDTINRSRKYPEEKMISERIRLCEKKIGYLFEDKTLLVSALKHRSFLSVSNEERYKSNERLEFLGDAVLELITTRYLYDKYPHKSEGELSKMKAILVSRKILSKVALNLDLGKYILLNYGEEKSGGRNRLSILADTIEAILGAIYLDSDFERTDEFVKENLLRYSNKFLQLDSMQNYKSRLLEYSQSKGWGVPLYTPIAEIGPDHDKEFDIAVIVEGNKLSVGRGSSKKQAEQEAAKQALKILKKKKHYKE